MFSNWFIALILTVGAGTWVYTYFSKKTGGQPREAAIMALVVSFIVFIVSFWIVSLIPGL